MAVCGSLQALKEKAELQAQLAALHTRLQAQLEHSHSSQQRQDSLSSEVDTLKQSCWDLEQAMTDLQNMLEAKNASLASSNSDLRVAEEQYQRLMAKVEEMQRSILSKDNTGERSCICPLVVCRCPGAMPLEVSSHLLWLLFSCSVVSDSLRPHGLQHARLPCPSPSPRACSHSCPLSW